MWRGPKAPLWVSQQSARSDHCSQQIRDTPEGSLHNLRRWSQAILSAGRRKAALGVVCRDRNTLSELQSGGPQGRRRQLTKLFAIFARKVTQMPEPALKRRVFYCGSVLKFLARGHQPLPAQVAMQFHIPGAERRILQGTS